MFVFFFFNQKTAYEMRISDWSSDVCASDLGGDGGLQVAAGFGERTQRERQRSHILGHRDLLGDVGRRLERHRAEGANRRLAVFVQSVVALVGRERSEERRVGKEGLRSWKHRGSPYY